MFLYIFGYNYLSCRSMRPYFTKFCNFGVQAAYILNWPYSSKNYWDARSKVVAEDQIIERRTIGSISQRVRHNLSSKLN